MNQEFLRSETTDKDTTQTLPAKQKSKQRKSISFNNTLDDSSSEFSLKSNNKKNMDPRSKKNSMVFKNNTSKKTHKLNSDEIFENYGNILANYKYLDIDKHIENTEKSFVLVMFY